MSGPKRIILLGASLDTGNNGVSALFASSVKCVLKTWPSALISTFDGSRGHRSDQLLLAHGQRVHFGCVGVRISKAVWRRDHLLRLLLTALVLRLIPSRSRRQSVLARIPVLRSIASADFVADITGGDSFSDVYGMRRFLLGGLRKLLILAVGADLVLLPQTYGPFKRRVSKIMARFLIRRAARVYSRDKEGLATIRSLIGTRSMRSPPRFAPDVAFILDPVEPDAIRTRPGAMSPGGGGTLVGLNVNGLLASGGYTRDNMFGLRADYPRLVADLARAILARSDTTLLLVPHVFVSSGHVESDYDACRNVFEGVSSQHAGRVFLLEGDYNQSEIKYVIGRCDFFIGSRMHACIAAVSQNIPTVPLAYSKKFAGVFESIGLSAAVSDLRSAEGRSVISHVLSQFDNRCSIAADLRSVIPDVQRQVLNLFGQMTDAAIPVAHASCDDA